MRLMTMSIHVETAPCLRYNCCHFLEITMEAYSYLIACMYVYVIAGFVCRDTRAGAGWLFVEMNAYPWYRSLPLVAHFNGREYCVGHLYFHVLVC